MKYVQFSYLKRTNMPFSLFVYYNQLVHISKTTKVTTLAQENFFFVLKKSIKWDQNRVSILWSNFGQTDQAMKSAAQGGPDDWHQKNFVIKTLPTTIPFIWNQVCWPRVSITPLIHILVFSLHIICHSFRFPVHLL